MKTIIMKFSIIFLACLALVAGESYVERKSKIADKDFLIKQKFFLEILHHIHEPLQFDEYLKVSDNYVEDKSAYIDFEEVEHFFHLYHLDFLTQGHIFSVFNEKHREDAIYLFNFFYNSKDWATFYKNVCWARVHVNEGMFIYVLSMAVLHRDDCRGIVLPAIYEICPYMFFDGRVIKDAYEFRTTYEANKDVLKQKQPIKMWEHKFHLDHETPKTDEFYKNYDVWYTWSNYSQEYYEMNDESQLSYFTEDIGWNSYYYYYHLDYPFWMDGKKFDLVRDRRGELFLYMHQQLLARYYMERLSKHLGSIPEFSLYKPIEYGYNSHLAYYNGHGFTIRKNYYEIANTEEYFDMQLVSDYERRIHDIIDIGFYTTRDGHKIDMRKPESIDILGNLIQSNPDSVDKRFFGYWMLISHYLLGGTASIDFSTEHFVVPSVMEHYETALRDPVFYMLYKRIVKKYNHFKSWLPSYKHEELLFNGVEIKDAHIDDIVTYFYYHNADLTNLMGYEFLTEEKNVVFNARQERLTFHPFEMKLDVQSNKAQKVIVRTFLGPSYDEFGKEELSFDENLENFYEIDQFVYELPSGKSVITRSSEEFYWNVKQRTSYTELYKQVMLAIDGKYQFPLDMSEAHCGFPRDLIIPRGWTSGMPVKLFYMIMPYVEVDQYSKYDHLIECGVGSGHRYIDNRPFGYPLDRQIEALSEFMVPNMYLQDAVIYHEKHYENLEAKHMPQY